MKVKLPAPKKHLRVRTPMRAGCRPGEEIVYFKGKPHCLVVA